MKGYIQDQSIVLVDALPELDFIHSSSVAK
jgi:hypothetical protein